MTAVVAVATQGCNAINSLGPNCDRSPTTNPPVKYTEGVTKDGIYMSSPWDGPLLWFPGGMRYELPHNLGAAPRFIEPWLSFDEQGTDAGTVALAAGNQAEVREVDAQKIVIVNGSCSDYWLLVVAGTGDKEPQPGGTGGGGGAGGGP
jgi:hypothetical protein